MEVDPVIETARVAVLCVSPDAADGACLADIFQQPGWRGYSDANWSLITRGTLGSAFLALRQVSIPLVICEADLSPGTWRDVLEFLMFLPDPPFLIVTSRLADDRLWAEALNLGAYDVLAKPFERNEVIRVVSLAWQHWCDRRHPDGARGARSLARQYNGAIRKEGL